MNYNPEPHREGVLENVAPSLRRKWQWCQGNKSELTRDMLKALHLNASDYILEIKLLPFSDKKSCLVWSVYFSSLLFLLLWRVPFLESRGRNNGIWSFKRLTWSLWKGLLFIHSFQYHDLLWCRNERNCHKIKSTYKYQKGFEYFIKEN